MELFRYLPIYPEFDNELSMILDEKEIDEPYKLLVEKKEFYDTRLERYEDRPLEKGQYMNHQKFVARFLSSHTPYSGLLIMHEPGTGKTCLSVAVIEQIRKERTDLKRALVLMGRRLIPNYIDELANVCTSGEYLPNEEEEELSENLRKLRIRKAIRSFYDIESIDTFVNEIQSLSDTRLRKLYNNHVIVIDEAHNLRRHAVSTEDNDEKEVKEKGKPSKLYHTIHRFLHVVENCKILLLTGTPMKDRPYEIADIMNLLLPLDKQMPVEDNFMNEFMDKQTQKLKQDQETQEKFKNYLKGRVSFLKAIKSDTKKKFIGEIKLSFSKLYQLKMSKYQSNVYEKAYKEDEKESSFYINSRQASLFTFPDDLYGNKGFKKFLKFEKRNKMIEGSVDRYLLTKEFKDLLLKDTSLLSTIEEKHAKILENIREFSCKFAECISKILKYPDQLHFVFSEFVSGSGTILFARILELFGLSEAHGNEMYPGSRYALLSTITASQNKMTELRDLFNRPENAHGKYARVIIGSQILSEGFTLKNVQHVHILTPTWNYSETDQVIARAFRLFSHSNLSSDTVVKIYFYCAFTDDDNKEDTSIDYKMYKICEDKDIPIKSIERAIKESSIDCVFNKRRNKSYHPDRDDYTRDCEYMKCDYTCDFVDCDLEMIDTAGQDTSTFDLYYDDEEIINIKKRIKDIFKSIYKITLSELALKIKNVSQNSLLKAIYKLITSNEIFYDHFGYKCFLRNQHDYLYITHQINMTSNNGFFDLFYTEYFSLYYSRISNAIQMYQNIKLPLLFNEMKNNYTLINEFNSKAKEMIMEYTLLSRRDVKKEIPLRDFLLDHFRSNYIKLDDGTYVLQKQKRCLAPSSTQWKPCTVDEIKMQPIKLNTWLLSVGKADDVKHTKCKDQTQTYTKEDGEIVDMHCVDEFKIYDLILDLHAEVTGSLKERAGGRVCHTIDKTVLIKYIYRINRRSEKLIQEGAIKNLRRYKIHIDDEKDEFDIKNKKSTKELIEFYNEKLSNEKTRARFDKIEKVFDISTLKKMNKEDLSTILYWGSKKKEEICMHIQKWFIENQNDLDTIVFDKDELSSWIQKLEKEFK